MTFKVQLRSGFCNQPVPQYKCLTVCKLLVLSSLFVEALISQTWVEFRWWGRLCADILPVLMVTRCCFLSDALYTAWCEQYL